MAQSGSAHGHMEIQDQKDTFHGFLMASVWGCCLVAQTIALLTVGFAIGAGWWSGLVALALIGAVVGFVFRMSGVYWAVQVALWILLGLGGLIVPALSGMMG
jgi:hypothetical protein